MREMSSTSEASWRSCSVRMRFWMSCGAHAVVGPDDRDHRDVDFREDIDGHAQRGADPHERDQDQHGHDGVGPLQRGFDNGHAEFPYSLGGVPI